MRAIALAKRILRQILRDKRTLGLLIFAPILVLSLVYLVFHGNEMKPKIGLVDLPTAIQDQMDGDDAEVTSYRSANKALEDLKHQELDAYMQLKDGSPFIMLEGSDPSRSRAALKWFQENINVGKDSGVSLQVNYLYGSSDMEQFDTFGPFLLGFFIFFFVFLIAGISFLRERTSGTLERLLASPLRKWEIVIGYILGFGLFSIIQAVIIVSYAIFVLGMLMEGAFIHVFILTFALSLTALTLGILLSTFASNELQMMQFIPIIVIPQIFFSGLFNLETISKWLSWIGPVTPIYYASQGLKDVMIRGNGWSDIYIDVLVLLGFSIIFVLLNILVLRKYRRI